MGLANLSARNRASADEREQEKSQIIKENKGCLWILGLLCIGGLIACIAGREDKNNNSSKGCHDSGYGRTVGGIVLEESSLRNSGEPMCDCAQRSYTYNSQLEDTQIDYSLKQNSYGTKERVSQITEREKVTVKKIYTCPLCR